MPWATAAECVAVTGTTPDAATLALAHSSLRPHINRTEDEVTAIARARDLEWLRDAVAWQAAWLPSQPGYATRMGAASVSQDGLTMQHNSAADQLLAPLAQRALKNLSWMGTKSLRTRPRGVPAQSSASFLRSDPETGWDPL